MESNARAKTSTRPNQDNSKANNDGVNFQHHLYYYAIGLCHNKTPYSALYEGDMRTYGALDDVILKINPDRDGSNPEALYLIQAKQSLEEHKQMSLFDLLHPGNGFTKYIESYVTYRSSEAYRSDGPPTQMIYWTSIDVHSTTKQVMEVYDSRDDHLRLTADTPIVKYWIKDWRKLFIFEIASKLKDCAEARGKKIDDRRCKLESVARVLVREAVEPVQVQTVQSGASKVNLKFRQEFLDGSAALSEHAVILRDCLVLAYRTKNAYFEERQLKKLASLTFDDIFGVDFASVSGADGRQCVFEYKGLNEEELDQFFSHFIYYVNVPKGETMVNLLSSMFNQNFSEQIFAKYLIPRGGFVEQSFVESIIELVKLTNQIGKSEYQAPISSVDFCEASELEKTIDLFLKPNPPLAAGQRAASSSLTVVAQTCIEWTVSRVVTVLRKASCKYAVIQNKDISMLVDALGRIEEKLLLGELQIVVAVDLKAKLQLPESMRTIALVQPTNLPTIEGGWFEDHIHYGDIQNIHFDQFVGKRFIIDDKEIALEECCGIEEINRRVDNLVELYDLQLLEVKSDVYDYNEKHYVEREVFEKNSAVDRSVLTFWRAQSVSILSDTAGQGKTVELLRIAKDTMNGDDAETLCLYFRAKTIANGIPPEDVNCIDAFQSLPQLLHLEPRSAFTEKVLSKCLGRRKVILLVDGFDEIVEEAQTVVIKFIKSVLERTTFSLVIAARTEAKSKLESAFKNAKCYTLGKFAYEQYFEKIWLQDETKPPPTEILRSNMKYFIENFDHLLRRAGCKLFLETPQFCRIMGSIYQDLIRKPNFKLHNNYEIGAVYDAFVQSQFANTFEGYFDEKRLKDAMAVRVLKRDFLFRHMELALYNQYYRCKQPNAFRDLVHYDLLVNQDDQYEFVHMTVMEYFLVRFFMLEDIHGVERRTAFLKFLQRYFCVSRANIADKFIDFFLGDERWKELTETKRHIIVKYLQTNPKHLPTFVRTTLNNATFNTLRLLFSITPEPMLLALCFRFGSVKQTNDGKKGAQREDSSTSEASTDNEINLKRLGENQLILFLQAVEESDDGRPGMMQNVLFPTDPEEEDIIEVSIRKPFPEVFDKVIKYCTEKCFEAFEHHVQARLERYAQVIVQHCYAENKERMIDKLIRLCKDTLSAETISTYLQCFDLFKVVVDNIEVETTGKKFVENDRLDMLGKILTLLDEYLDPERLAVRKQQGKEQLSKLRNESIKNRLNKWLNE